MYNIKQAAARAGVSVPVLRAWERRYGIVRPPRTASGYRLFDDESVARIRTMRGLVEAGWSPSAAAAAILDGWAPALPNAAGGAANARGDSDGGNSDAGRASSADRSVSTDANSGNERERLAERLIEAARQLDAPALDDVLDELFSRGSFERVAGDLLFPALQRLGEAWAAGEVSVAGEHLASNAILRRLGLALDAVGRGNGRGDTIVVGLPPGARHELGALAFAVSAARAGLGVRYLGPDLPTEDWVSAASDVDAAVIGVVTARDRAAALKVARAIKSAHPRVVVAVGGRAAPAAIDILDLPEALTDSVAALSAALAANR